MPYDGTLAIEPNGASEIGRPMNRRQPLTLLFIACLVLVVLAIGAPRIFGG